MEKRVIQVHEKVPILQGLPLSLQHLFAMFGASVLVPSIFKIDTATVLLMNGIGTLIYLIICKGKVPAFLGSSFAFIAPVLIVMKTGGYSHALGGFIVSGLIFILVALIIGLFGSKWIDVVLPPATIGPIVALIGLDLAGTAAQMAGFVTSDYHKVITSDWVIVAIITLATIMIGMLMFRGFLSIIPVLVGILVGYIVSIPMGLVDFNAIINTLSPDKLFKFPTIYTPVFDKGAILSIVPAALVVISEHIGHLMVTGNIVGKDLTKDPGLHRSLMGDGVSTVISGFMGSVPTTTYGENIGVMAITKVYSVWIIGGAAVLSILLSFSNTLSEFVRSIPQPVMGGVCILLFGVIVASGLRVLVEAKVDYSKSKNLILTAIVLIIGVSSITIKFGTVELRGMPLATIVGMLLSLIIYIIDRLKLINE